MSLLHYTTFKYVVIRDRRVGAAYYILVVAVLTYACSEIFVDKGYLEYDKAPLGTLRLILKNGKSRSTTAADEPYCCLSHADDPAKLDSNVRSCENCRHLDAKDLSWPVETRSATIATFIKERWQRRNVTATSTDGISTDSGGYITEKNEKYYTLAPEAALLKVEHSFVAGRFTQHSTGKERLSSSNRLMDGYLYHINGTRLRMISSEGHADKIGLDELLHAAGVEDGLDTSSDAPNAEDKSIRSRGGVLRVSIAYENDRDVLWGTGDPEYSYHVRRVPYAEFCLHELVPIYQLSRDSKYAAGDASCTGSGASCEDNSFSSSGRLIRKRCGIHVTFEQSGKLGMFSYASLLTKLLASFTLIPLIPTLIEIAILYLLPGSVRYKKSVIEVEAGVEAESDEVGEADSDSSQDSPSAGGATCDTKRSEDEHCPDVENLPKALQGVTSDQTESSVPDGTQQREVTEAGDGLLVKNGSSSKDGSTARQRLAKSAGDEQ